MKNTAILFADQIEIALPGAEFGSDARARPVPSRRNRHHRQRSRSGQKPASYRQHLQEVRFGVLGQRLGDLEEPMGARPVRMDDPLGNPLMVKMRNLFPPNEIF
jgi:hypothetical protein